MHSRRCAGCGRGLFERSGFLRRSRPWWLCGLAGCVLVMLPATACVRRTMTITTQPPQALVFLNDEEVGRSPVSTDFLWYGDYEVVIRQEGYETLHTHWRVRAPWYQLLPLDFISEVLWPGRIHDEHFRHFELEPATTPTREELLDRAMALRQRAEERRR